MKEIGEHGGRGAGADQAFGLEGLDRGVAEPLGLGVEQPAVGTAEAIGLQRPLQGLRLQQHRQAGERALRDRRRGERGQRRPEMLLHLRRDGDASRAPGWRRSIRPPRRARRRRRCAASGCSETEARRVVGQGAAEIVPVAAHGERGGADRAAEIEGEDLSARIAAELQRHQRQQHRLAGAGRTDHQRMADIADMQREAERRRALGLAEEQRRRARNARLGPGPPRPPRAGSCGRD